MTGRRLGVYQVLDLLGAGGMGEVYRARDTRLQRDVAIKALPTAFAADPERLARFEREAQLLASLNHPNIATIYGLEDADGARAIVMELVAGETLAERLARGPFPVAEALAIARQIADALDAAHEKGIIHRDLKPANIKLTPDGAVKVLDFGLAKLAAVSDSDVTAMATREGGIVGTPAYMSPEQARGQTLDKRADIWAFGSVVYEMLAGQRALDDPDWAALPPGTPRAIVALLQRCLERDVKKRQRDIGDARYALDASAESERPIVAPAPRPQARRVAWVFGGIAILATALGTWAVVRRPAVEPAVGSMTRLTWDGGFASGSSISADGRLIAYASDRGGNGLDIWVQQASGGRPIRLTAEPEADYEPDVSPDGNLVVFHSDRSPAGVYIVPALGGDARLIAPGGRAPKFSPDGKSVAFWTGRWLAPRSVSSVRRSWIVPVDVGDPVEIETTLASSGDPAWSPDGGSLVVFGRRATAGGDLQTDWWLVRPGRPGATRTEAFARLEAAGIDTRAIDDQPFPVEWTESGVLFVGRPANSESISIWSLGIDAETGEAKAPVRLTTATGAHESPAAARDGRLVFASHSRSGVVLGLPLDANAGKATGPLTRLRPVGAPTRRTAISADGRTLLFYVTLLGRSELWVRDLPSGRERLIATTPPAYLNPVVSADGAWAAYTVTATVAGGSSGLGEGYVIPVNGGAPRKICDACEVFEWETPGQRLFVHSGAPGRLDLLNVTTGVRQHILTANQFVDRPIVFPGGKWIALSDNRALVAPFHPDRPLTEAELTPAVIVDGQNVQGRHAGLSPDGRLLYVLLETDGFRCLYAVQIDLVTGRPTGAPFVVHHLHDPSLQWGSTGYGNAVANGWFVLNLAANSGDLWMTTLESRSGR